LPELVTPDEVAEWLKTTRKAVYAKAERGTLPGATYIGRRLYFFRSELLRCALQVVVARERRLAQEWARSKDPDDREAIGGAQGTHPRSPRVFCREDGTRSLAQGSSRRSGTLASVLGFIT